MKKFITAALIATVAAGAAVSSPNAPAGTHKVDYWELNLLEKGQSPEYIDIYESLDKCIAAGKSESRGHGYDTLKVKHRSWKDSGTTTYYDVQIFNLFSGGYKYRNSFTCTHGQVDRFPGEKLKL